MLDITFNALRAFPDQLEQHYRAIPEKFVRWKPASWEGIPSETLTAHEQICHERDIETLGYHVRIRRLLAESDPLLASLDTYELVSAMNYAATDAFDALRAFRAARDTTMTLIADLSEAQLTRRGRFDGYGPLTLKSLIHYLCSHDQQHLAGLQWLLGQMESE